jgi:hypothetical protein
MLRIVTGSLEAGVVPHYVHRVCAGYLCYLNTSTDHDNLRPQMRGKHQPHNHYAPDTKWQHLIHHGSTVKKGISPMS